MYRKLCSCTIAIASSLESFRKELYSLPTSSWNVICLEAKNRNCNVSVTLLVNVDDVGELREEEGEEEGSEVAHQQVAELLRHRQLRTEGCLHERAVLM